MFTVNNVRVKQSVNTAGKHNHSMHTTTIFAEATVLLLSVNPNVSGYMRVGYN
jgi:hypothetical protein